MILRNWLFDVGIFRVYQIPVPSICVGNLSVGGTGKTPHVELFTRWLLEENKKVAILSRGYGRKTKGVLEVNSEMSSGDCGDEPLQYKLKFQDNVVVVVAEQRELGVKFILEKNENIDVILLDDAFQHRKVKCGMYLLITPYDSPFFRDFVLPAGNLREPRSGKNRADAIIVSKCPSDISEKDESRIISRLGTSNEKVFFSKVGYNDIVQISEQPISNFKSAVVVTGIGNPEPFIGRISTSMETILVKYPDHHEYKSNDIREIHQKIDTFAHGNCAVITTEKDYMRLRDNELNAFSKGSWFYWPISVIMKNEEKLKKQILDYVG